MTLAGSHCRVFLSGFFFVFTFSTSFPLLSEIPYSGKLDFSVFLNFKKLEGKSIVLELVISDNVSISVRSLPCLGEKVVEVADDGVGTDSVTKQRCTMRLSSDVESGD